MFAEVVIKLSLVQQTSTYSRTDNHMDVAFEQRLTETDIASLRTLIEEIASTDGVYTYSVKIGLTQASQVPDFHHLVWHDLGQTARGYKFTTPGYKFVRRARDRIAQSKLNDCIKHRRNNREGGVIDLERGIVVAVNGFRGNFATAHAILARSALCSFPPLS
jgi:hypothetical protein